MAKNLGKIEGSHDFQSKWINFIASKFMAKKLGKVEGSHDFQSKWINYIANCFKSYGKCKIFLMAVYMIFKYGKRFRLRSII